MTERWEAPSLVTVWFCPGSGYAQYASPFSDEEFDYKERCEVCNQKLVKAAFVLASTLSSLAEDLTERAEGEGELVAINRRHDDGAVAAAVHGAAETAFREAASLVRSRRRRDPQP